MKIVLKCKINLVESNIYEASKQQWVCETLHLALIALMGAKQ